MKRSTLLVPLTLTCACLAAVAPASRDPLPAVAERENYFVSPGGSDVADGTSRFGA